MTYIYNLMLVDSGVPGALIGVFLPFSFKLYSAHVWIALYAHSETIDELYG